MSTAMAAKLPPPEMTVDEWADMDEDEPGELVDGQLVEEEVPDIDHEGIVVWIVAMFFNWLATRGGLVFGSEVKYAVRPKGGRKPDLAVYLPGSPAPLGRGVVRLPPDIMIEVISRRPRDVRRDRVEKPTEYAAFGVRYYWLIDPDARTLEVYELQAASGYLRIVGTSGGAIDVPGCPELRLDLDAMWAHAARLVPPSNVTRLRKVKPKQKGRAKR